MLSPQNHRSNILNRLRIQVMESPFPYILIRIFYFKFSERKKEILTKEFVLRSIEKFNINGELLMDVRLKDILKTLNIKEKKYVNKYNLNLENIKETEQFLQNRLKKRVLFINNTHSKVESRNNISWNNMIKNNSLNRNFVIGIIYSSND